MCVSVALRMGGDYETWMGMPLLELFEIITDINELTEEENERIESELKAQERRTRYHG